MNDKQNLLSNRLYGPGWVVYRGRPKYQIKEYVTCKEMNEKKKQTVQTTVNRPILCALQRVFVVVVVAECYSDGRRRPNNVGRGYVVRRVLRRGARYGRKYLNAEIGSFFSKTVPTQNTRVCVLKFAVFSSFFASTQSKLPTTSLSNC
jgi:hypothetical protein